MKLTAEEKLMYEVMKAIFDSGIPISFKGAMVLKACLIEAGYPEETRHTVDIDANWNSDAPLSASQMTESLQQAIEKSRIDINVSIYRMYGEKRSAGFELTDSITGKPLFSMDIDVNRPTPKTTIYEVEGFRFRGATISQIISDKIAVISTDKVFRRIKDVVDLYYISRAFVFNKTEVIHALESNRKKLGNFHGFLSRAEELQHAYEKFRFAGDVSKPEFDEVYDAVKTYIRDVLPEEGKS